MSEVLSFPPLMSGEAVVGDALAAACARAAEGCDAGLITYRLDDLRAATKAIQDAESKAKGNAAAMKLIAQAKALVAKVPINAGKASEKSFNGIFKKKRKKATVKVTGRQAEFEQAWDTQIKANYAKAEALANKAASM